MPKQPLLASLALCAACVAGAVPVAGQGADGDGRHATLERFRTLDSFQLAVFGWLAGQPGASAADSTAEATLVERLGARLRGEETERGLTRMAEEGRRSVGDRGAAILEHAQAFQREVLGVLAELQPPEHADALGRAVEAYGESPYALPAVPKNMDVLYDHAFALDFRTRYPRLSGLLWAGHWSRLAATEPLTDLANAGARSAGLDTVTARFRAKLEEQEAPRAFPTEVPLAPAIAPGLIWASVEAAVIWDNASMLLEVVADVLAAGPSPDRHTALDATWDFFLDPTAGVTDRDEWEIMALRHGIFFQGGYPLAVMTANERNHMGHGAHGAGGRVLMAIPGMPGR